MGKGHKLVSKKGKMVNFTLGETNVFLPVFDPCTTHSHFYFFFSFTSYYTIFSSLAFRIRRSHCSYPSSSLSALVFISIQHLSVTFFSESPCTNRDTRTYGHHGMSLLFPVLTAGSLVSSFWEVKYMFFLILFSELLVWWEANWHQFFCF